MSPATTLYQKARLLIAVKRDPGLSTPELARIVDINRCDTAYAELRKLALKGQVFSRHERSPYAINRVCHWYPVEHPLAAIPKKKRTVRPIILDGMTHEDLYYHYYWSQPRHLRAVLKVPKDYCP